MHQIRLSTRPLKPFQSTPAYSVSRRAVRPPSARLWGDSAISLDKVRVSTSQTTPLQERTLCVTHNDWTGVIAVTAGGHHGAARLRDSDAVLGRWHRDESGEIRLELSCRLDGTNPIHKRIAPLRRTIFRREMGLIIDCIFHAESRLLRQTPELLGAMTWVHFASQNKELNSKICLGPLLGASHVMRQVEALREIRPRSNWRHMAFLLRWLLHRDAQKGKTTAIELSLQLALLLSCDLTAPPAGEVPNHAQAIWQQTDAVLDPMQQQPICWGDMVNVLVGLQRMLAGCAITRAGVAQRLSAKFAPACRLNAKSDYE